MKAAGLATVGLLIAGAAQATTASDLIGYVGRHAGSFQCSEVAVDGRQFVHCRSAPNCAVPNLLFEIRGATAVWANGKAGSFVDAYPRHPVRIIDGRPLPYTAGDVFKALGCPG